MHYASIMKYSEVTNMTWEDVLLYYCTSKDFKCFGKSSNIMSPNSFVHIRLLSTIYLINERNEMTLTARSRLLRNDSFHYPAVSCRCILTLKLPY